MSRQPNAFGRPSGSAATMGILAVFAVALAVSAGPAVAQPFTWLLPAGGETWTAGTTHSIEWTGGTPSGNVSIVLAQTMPPYTAVFLNNLTLNSGYFTWSIPSNQAPGTYQLNVSEVFPPNALYSQTFTIQPGVECLSACYPVTYSMPAVWPLAGACGATAPDALAAAEAYVLAQMEAACMEGFSIAPGSVMIDATILPVGFCLSGYSGAFVAEAAGVACCCPDVVPAEDVNWGSVKSLYR